MIVSDRSSVARVLWTILALNLLVAAAKIAYGLFSGAISVMAGGLHSALDASSNVIGLVGVHVAARPPDSDHPYGHRKFETMAALGIAVLMLLACLRIATAAFERIRSSRLPDIGPAGFAVLAGTMAVNLWVARFERNQGERLRSEVLLADASHTQTDVWTTLLVMVSFFAVLRGYPWADLVAAFVIVGVIAWAMAGILRRAMGTLADASRVPPEAVEALALGVEGVLECHEVRSRGALGDIHVDLHALVDPQMAIADAHRIGHRVEQAVRQAYPEVTDVVVHVEPALESERMHGSKEGGAEGPKQAGETESETVKTAR